MQEVNEVIGRLETHYKKQWEDENKRKLEEWWPMSGDFVPPQLEIIMGAILTQNTNWRNVEKALGNMIRAGLVDADTIARCDKFRLQRTIKPAGFFVQKSQRLREICRLIRSREDFFDAVKREELLAVKGIGKETADAIMLYACGKEEFVVDAYTYRVFSRYGLLGKDMKYGEIKKFFESQLPRDADTYRRAHALIVEHAKAVCKKEPLCQECPLEKCRFRERQA